MTAQGTSYTEKYGESKHISHLLICGTYLWYNQAKGFPSAFYS